MANNFMSEDAVALESPRRVSLSPGGSATIDGPPVQARKRRGKMLSRRTGQNPKVRIRRRADGSRVYYFQYWIDLPGVEDRKRMTEVIGLVGQMTKSEAERKKLDFISKLQVNSAEYRIPSAHKFSDAIEYYRTEFGPTMHRPSTLSTWNSRITKHLEPDWKDCPLELITIQAVNEWAWKKRQAGLSWVAIKDALRTMQRVLSAFPKNTVAPFSQKQLRIPERDKLQMQIGSRQRVSFSWEQAVQIAGHISSADGLGITRREQYAALVLLAAASGLRCGELLALRGNDIDFRAKTIRVEQSTDQRNGGRIGPCKNATAYRTVYLGDAEGHTVLVRLKRFLRLYPAPGDSLIFHSKRGAPLLQTTILNQGLHPALEALKLRRAGLHAFRRGCNRRWELAGVNPAVIRQQMGHTSAAMTRLYTGEIPIEHVEAEFSTRFGNRIDVLENVENGAAA
jgi:integrase